MLTEMAGELRHALEQVSEPSAKEEKTELIPRFALLYIIYTTRKAF